MPPQSQASIKNKILAALPDREYDRLGKHLTPVSFTHGDLLYKTEQRIKHVYFVNSGVVSLVANMKDGRGVEVGLVGNDGMVGLSVALGDDVSPTDAIVQIADGALRLNTDELKKEMGREGKLLSLLQLNALVMIKQVSQTAACNGSHTVGERLARWLLMCHDRVPGDEIKLTQEFISQMLGIRRSGVSEAATLLQSRNLISYSRGNITIMNRSGLEAFACECYGIVKAEYDRLFKG